MLVSVANPPPLYDPQTNATPSTNDRRVAKADLLRREMSWSSDDALTPAPRTYACGRDFYYDDESDVETPVARHVPPGSSARVARQNGRTGRDAGLTGSQAQRDVGVDGNGNRVRARGNGDATTSAAADGSDLSAGALLCAQGDKACLGFEVPKSKQLAFEAYLRAAEEYLYVPAFARIGSCYLDEGSGAGSPSVATAMEWFAKGAEFGDTQCYVRLGELYEKRGDMHDAYAWFSKALSAEENKKEDENSNNGTSKRDAQVRLARFAEFGWAGVAVDLVQARDTYEKCANQGCALAQRSFAMLLLKGAESENGDGDSGAKNDAAPVSGPVSQANSLNLATGYLKLAVAQGDAEAMNQLGMLYEDGLVFDEDDTNGVDVSSWGDSDTTPTQHALHPKPEPPTSLGTARRLYARAAKLGHERAMNNLGFACAAAGDAEEAAVCFKKGTYWAFPKSRHTVCPYKTLTTFRVTITAALDGDVDAMFNLGNFHETGVGVEVDLKEAKRLYARAAAGGHEDARDAVTRLASDEKDGLASELPKDGRVMIVDGSGSSSPNGNDGVSADSGHRRRLREKETEIARLALDLQTSRNETAALDELVSDLKREVGSLQKFAEAGKQETPRASQGGFTGTFSSLGGNSAPPNEPGSSDANTAGSQRDPPTGPLRDPSVLVSLRPEFTRSTSLMSNKSGHSNYSAYSGLSGVSAAEDFGVGGSIPGKKSLRPDFQSRGNSECSSPSRGPLSKRSRGSLASEASRIQAKRRDAAQTKRGRGASIFGMFSSASRKSGSGGASFDSTETDKTLAKAHAREMHALKLEMQDMGFKAEVHEEMAEALSTLLKSTYARNLQLETLLKSVGLDADDPAVGKDLHPIRVDTVAGIALGDAGVFRSMPPGDDARFGKGNDESRVSDGLALAEGG